MNYGIEAGLKGAIALGSAGGYALGARELGSSMRTGAAFGATGAVVVLALNRFSPVGETNKKIYNLAKYIITFVGGVILPFKLGIVSSINGLMAFHLISATFTIPLSSFIGAIALMTLGLIRGPRQLVRDLSPLMEVGATPEATRLINEIKSSHRLN